MQGDLIGLGVETFKLALLISLPMLMAGLIAGLLISIFQATTQINEMTLSFVPKIILVVIVIIFLMPWMMSLMIDFTELYAKRDMMNRYNSLFLGELEGKETIKIVGFMSQFAKSYGDNSKNYLFKALRGPGLNDESKFEGVRINNFMGTYVLGPILVFNPDFTKYLLRLLGVKEPKIAFEKEAVEAYNIRLKEFENPNIAFD